MDKLKIELHDPVINRLGVDAIIDFYKTIATETLEFPGLFVCMTAISDAPFLNVVIDTRTNEKYDPEIMATIKNFYNRFNMSWVWFVSPIAKVNHLEQQGFRLIEQAPGMYFDLTQSLPEIKINQLEIKEADATDDLSDWTLPLQEGFPSDDNCEAYRKLNADLLHKGVTKLKHFVAYIQQEAVSCATLFVSGDSVMIHNLATKIAFQKRGIGKAVSNHLMAVAKNLGVKHCFLDSSDEGFKLYKSLEFKVYCVARAYELKQSA